jgi:hypothetical protein
MTARFVSELTRSSIVVDAKVRRSLQTIREKVTEAPKANVRVISVTITIA